MYPADNHVDELSLYPDYRKYLNFDGINFPVTLKDIDKFERQNQNSVNIFAYDKSKIVVAHLNKNLMETHVNLLLADNKDRGKHYCSIKRLSALVGLQCSSHNGKKYFCEKWLHYFQSQSNLVIHKIDCKRMNECRINLPTEDKKILRFSNHRKKIRAPFVVYADTESILGEVKSSFAPEIAYNQHLLSRFLS